MPGYLSSIGFLFEADGEFETTMERLANASNVRLAVSEGDYAIWRSRTGAEIWFHVIGDRQEDGELAGGGIIGLQTFFEPSHTTRVTIDRALPLVGHGDDPFTGVLVGHVRRPGTGGSSGDPIVFEAVDFAAHATREMPFAASARIVGFARVISAYADLAAFKRARSETAGLEVGSFVSTGLKAVSDGSGIWTARDPSAHALVVGEVLEHTIHRNEETGLDFHHLLLSSSGGPCEIIAESSVVPRGLRKGGFASAMCWLVGRLLDDT